MERMPTEKQIISWRANQKTGFFLQVDLEYPKELHDKHNGYPLAPEKIKVSERWQSPYQKKLAKELNITKDKAEKLLLTLKDKKNYVVYYRNLQLYLSLGMRLKKVHIVIAFDQKDWMEPYIRLNTKLRKKATSDFEKNFFKLMNNAVFGKTMENLRNRTNIVLVRVNEQKKLRELLSHPLHDRYSVFGKRLALVGIQMHKDHFLMNRPIYTGMTVLELSCCMISTTTIWSPSMAQNASSSTQTPTLSYLRSRQMTSTKTWERTWITMTRVIFQRTIHCTAKKTRRFSGK